MATSGKLTSVPAPTHTHSAAVAPREAAVGIGGLLLLLAYATVEFVRPQDFVEPLSVLRPALVLTVLLSIYWVRTWGVKEIVGDKILVCVLLFLLLATLWIPFAANNFWAFQVTKSLWMYFLGATIPLGLYLTFGQRRRQFLGFWILIHLYLAVFVLANGGRGPTGFLQDENDMAYALCMAIPYPFFLAQKRGMRTGARLALIALTLVLLAGIVSTHSRGGFIGLACIVLYVIYLSRNRIRNLAICLVLGTVAFLFVPDSYVERVGSITDTEDTSRNERLTSWRIGWQMFLDYPILGVGPSNYAWRSGEYHIALPDFEPGDPVIAGRAAHSLYFALLPEYGLVGSGVFFALLVTVMRRLNRCERVLMQPAQAGDGDAETNFLVARALRASIIGYLTAGAFISVLYYPQFWFTLGFVIALSRDVSARYGSQPNRVPTV